MLEIGAILSLVPSSTPVVALTATVTKFLKSEIIRIVGMQNPISIVASPSRRNIRYVIKSFNSVDEALSRLLAGVRMRRTHFPQTIIYCRKLRMCGEVYLYFKDELDKDFMEPRDAPDMPRFRLVDMYHSRTDQCVKDAITSLFSDNLSLRIVVASVSYGMGIDCPHVRQVIHIGPCTQ
jgi:ATP-dependent DNA helicase RecQ